MKSTKVLILLLTAVGLLGLAAVLYFFSWSNAAAIGVIGGADGPTAMFIASRFHWVPLLLIFFGTIALVCLAMWAVNRWSARK